jgi:minor histocompatibility antigen H13
LKHWIANNIFGLAFAVNGIEFLQLNKIVNGCILLGGLFFYDIFWVFGTNVMVTVAKSFDAPIKRKVESTFFKLYFKIIKIFFSSDFSTRLD